MTDKNKQVSAARTIPHLIKNAAATYQNSVALSDEHNGRTRQLSFIELDEQSDLLAKGLIAKGIGKGSRVGLLYGNNADFAVIFAAIVKTGAIAIPVSTLIKANELVRVLRQSDLTGLFIQSKILDKDMIERVSSALPDLKHCRAGELRLTETPFLRWIVTDADNPPPSIHNLDWLNSAASSVSDTLLEQLQTEISPSDQVMEIYTSGSMAMPKGVKHNHGPIMARAGFILEKTPDAQCGATLTVILPLFWIGGLMMYLFPNLLVGATTCFTERTLSNSRFAMGSVMADEDLEAMKPRNGATIWALGMTETAGPYSYGDELRVPGYPLCAPLDHIAENFEVRVADSNNNTVDEEEIGEIQVRGYGLTPGLHKLERSDYFTDDGFYRTGDMGFRKGERILFTGRDGDIIKTASANVSPAEVELELQQLDGVHSAYVVGIPDKERGQLVVAAIVPREDAQPDLDSIESALRERLSGFKVPRAYILLSREEVPLLASNKVSRRELEKMMAARLSRD